MKKRLFLMVLGMMLLVSMAAMALDDAGNDIVNINVPYNVLLDVDDTSQSLSLEFDTAGDQVYKEDSIYTNNTLKFSHNSSNNRKVTVQAVADAANDPNDISLQAMVVGKWPDSGLLTIVYQGNDKNARDLWTNVSAGGYTESIRYKAYDATLAGTTAGNEVDRTYSWEILYTVLGD